MSEVDEFCGVWLHITWISYIGCSIIAIAIYQFETRNVGGTSGHLSKVECTQRQYGQSCYVTQKSGSCEQV